MDEEKVSRQLGGEASMLPERNIVVRLASLRYGFGAKITSDLGVEDVIAVFQML